MLYSLVVVLLTFCSVLPASALHVPAPLALHTTPLVSTPRSSTVHLAVDATTAATDCGCEPTASKGVSMNGISVTGDTLRATELVDALGARKTIGSVIGEEGKAVVIFLRHLG